MPKRVIVDVDVGLDDYLALLVLLAAEKRGEVKIEAITCTSGNTALENVCKNTLRLLEIANRTDIPVFRGVNRPFIDDARYITRHGADGFGDLQHETEPDVSLIRDTPSPIAMYDIVKNNDGQIDLICLAPLTNVALTVRLYEDFGQKLKGLYIMGGNCAGTGADFNFLTDPEAAFIVLQSFKCPITVVPLDTSLNLGIKSSWRFNTLAKIKGPLFDLLLKAERKRLEEQMANNENWRVPDSLIVISYLYPQDAVTKSNKYYATVELQGKYARGYFILDHLKQKEPNVEVIEHINREFVQKVLIQAAESLA